MDGLGQAGHVFGVDARHGDAAVASEVDAVPAGQGVHLQQGGQAAAGQRRRQLEFKAPTPQDERGSDVLGGL